MSVRHKKDPPALRPGERFTAGEHERRFTGELIKNFREQRGLNPFQAAQQAGVSRHVIYNWENYRLNSTAAKIVYWLLHDSTEKDGDENFEVAYWRTRAIMAEDSLTHIIRLLNHYRDGRKSLRGE